MTHLLQESPTTGQTDSDQLAYQQANDTAMLIAKRPLTRIYSDDEMSRIALFYSFPRITAEDETALDMKWRKRQHTHADRVCAASNKLQALINSPLE